MGQHTLCSEKYTGLYPTTVWDIHHTYKDNTMFGYLLDTPATSTEWAWMSYGRVCAHINTGLCVQKGKGQRKWGYGEVVAGIQLTGTSFQYHLDGDYPVCRDKRREGRTVEEAKKINRSEVKDKASICFQRRETQSRVNSWMPLGRIRKRSGRYFIVFQLLSSGQCPVLPSDGWETPEGDAWLYVPSL